MLVHILSIFPEFFSSPLNESMIKRAQEKGKIKIDVVNMRDFAKDKHKSMDDAPFGGEAGMVMMVEPLYEAIKSVAGKNDREKIVLTSPQGKRFEQNKAKELSTLDHLILVCGHYKGVDERIRDDLATDEISIGDYVITGGELGAMVVIDAVTRLLPGVLGDFTSAETDTFYHGLLEHGQYTRPRDFRGRSVPEVLLSGDHEAIRVWRRRDALRKTLLRRPDLFGSVELTEEDKRMLEALKAEQSEN